MSQCKHILKHNIVIWEYNDIVSLMCKIYLYYLFMLIKIMISNKIFREMKILEHCATNLK
jgi:hypothetical protein